MVEKSREARHKFQQNGNGLAGSPEGPFRPASLVPIPHAHIPKMVLIALVVLIPHRHLLSLLRPSVVFRLCAVGVVHYVASLQAAHGDAPSPDRRGNVRPIAPSGSN